MAKLTACTAGADAHWRRTAGTFLGVTASVFLSPAAVDPPRVDSLRRQKYCGASQRSSGFGAKAVAVYGGYVESTHVRPSLKCLQRVLLDDLGPDQASSSPGSLHDCDGDGAGFVVAADIYIEVTLV